MVNPIVKLYRGRAKTVELGRIVLDGDGLDRRGVIWYLDLAHVFHPAVVAVAFEPDLDDLGQNTP
jgi:hypothetical protein